MSELLDSYDDILKWSEVPRGEDFQILKVDQILLKYAEEDELKKSNYLKVAIDI